MRYSKIKKICAVCGTENTFIAVASSSSFGPCDLDTRSSGTTRYALTENIHICEKCNYSSYNISEVADEIKKIVMSSEYKEYIKEIGWFNLAYDILETTDGRRIAKTVISSEHKEYIEKAGCFNSARVKKFLASAYISQNLSKFSDVAWQYIKAAWVSDDYALNFEKRDEIYFKKGRCEAQATANDCRRLALKYISEAKIKMQKIAEDKNTSLLIEIDLLRRSSQFAEALKKINLGVKFKANKLFHQIIKFQKKLVDSEDSKCYTIEDAAKF